MNNKNKGVIGIGIILAIILGIAVIGGGAYYVGTKKKINNQTENLQSENNKNGNHKPYIRVLFPNGGEVFKTTNALDQIPIRWQSSNTSGYVSIFIKDVSADSEDKLMLSGIPDSGSSNIYGISSGEYRIRICDSKEEKNQFDITYDIPDCSVASDYSDNSFIVNSSFFSDNISIEDWKTYVNKEVGIEFKYPSNIEFSSGTDEYNIGTSMGYRGVVDASPNTIGTNPKTINESANMDVEFYSRNGKPAIVNNIKVDGQDSVVVCDPVSSLCEVHITLPKPKELRNGLSFKYLIIGVNVPEPFLKYDYVYQILSTFKFL